MELLLPLRLAAVRFSSKVIPATRGNLCEERDLDSEPWQSWYADLFSAWKLKYPQLLAICASLVVYFCKPVFVKVRALVPWLGKCLRDLLEDSWAPPYICSFRLSGGGPRIHMLGENLQVIRYVPQDLSRC